MTVSKKRREKALKLIRDFEEQRKENTYISESYLTYHGFNEEEALQTLEVLAGMGYIKYNRKPRVSEKYIELTDKGKCYFEVKKDEKYDFIKKNVLVPIIVSVITTLTTLLITDFIFEEKTNNIESNNSAVENKEK